eukprot:7217493-Prymnesium_polylepis.1
MNSFLAVLTTVISDLYSVDREGPNADLYSDLLMVLPFAVMGLQKLQNWLKLTDTGHARLRGAHELVAEIYQYRVHVGNYASLSDDTTVPTRRPQDRYRDALMANVQAVLERAGSANEEEPVELGDAPPYAEQSLYFTIIEKHMLSRLYGFIRKPGPKKASAAGGGSKQVNLQRRMTMMVGSVLPSLPIDMPADEPEENDDADEDDDDAHDESDSAAGKTSGSKKASR